MGSIPVHFTEIEWITDFIHTSIFPFLLHFLFHNPTQSLMTLHFSHNKSVIGHKAEHESESHARCFLYQFSILILFVIAYGPHLLGL